MNYQQISQAQYWRELIPELTIHEDGGVPSKPALTLSTDNLTRARLIEEGYIEFDAVIPHETTQKLKSAILTLRQHSWIPVFGYLYDEFWEIFFNLKSILNFALGENFQMLPDFWAWYLDPAKGDTGWGPHRDKNLNTLTSEGMPKSATVWIALTEATTLNGCMYLLPANKDSGYQDFEQNRPPTNIQAIRALPAPEGSVFLWNQRVYHWGGSSSKYAKGPRISMAAEFQRGNVPAYNQPLLQMVSIPSFKQRLELIGKQILQYTHMYHYSDELVSLAKAMAGSLAPMNSSVALSSTSIKRNDPCPCGSGKKYKHCHGVLS